MKRRGRDEPRDYSSDADDPLNMLGERGTSAAATALPSGPFRAAGPLRGLTGDRRTVRRGATAMLVDVEYETPRALLVTIQAFEQLSAGAIGYSIRTGLDRTPLRTDDYLQLADLALSRIIIARSVQVLVSYGATEPNPSVDVAAAVIPLDLNADASTVLGFTPATDRGPPNSGLSFIGLQAVGSVTLDSLITVPAQVAVFGPGRRAGFSVYNNSLSTLYLNLSGGFASPFSYTIPMVPASYFEAPYDYSGPMAFAFAAAGAGTAQFTVYGFDQLILP